MTLLALWRSIIPHPNDRLVHSSETLPRFAALNTLTFAGVFLQAFLARRQTSRLTRAALLPPLIIMTFYTAFNYYWTSPALNWFQGVAAFILVGKSLDFALSTCGSLKNGEAAPGQLSRSPQIIEAAKLVISMRGSGFQWSRGVYIPPSTHSPKRGLFLIRTAMHFFLVALRYDITETVLKCFPRVGHIEGGIFHSELPPVLRYVISTFICLLTGMCILCGMEGFYDITSFIAVGVLNNAPSSWPPVQGNPWMATSIRDFWGRQWHQLLRRTFIIYGGYPGHWIAGKVGFIIGTFLASGLLHELSAYTMGHGLKWQPVFFFVSQGVLIIVETLFKRVSGKSVRGWPGRIWTYIAVMGLCQPTADLWLRRGLGVTALFPTAWSPSRFFLRLLGITPP